MADDIDGPDSMVTNGNGIDVTDIVDVDVGVVGVVVIVIVIVDVLEEQLLVVPSDSLPFPAVPLLCLVCKHLEFSVSSKASRNWSLIFQRTTVSQVRNKDKRSAE